MRLLKNLQSISLPKTLALWGCSIVAYGLAYYSLSAAGHAISIEGTALSSSIGGFLDALYFSATSALSIGFSSSQSSVVTALGTSQLAVSAGFLTLFASRAAKAASPPMFSYPQLQHNLNKVLTKLYIYRYDVNRLLESLDKGTLTRHHMKDFWIMSSGADTALHELYEMVMHHLPEATHISAKADKLFREDMFKRVIAAVDGAFWNTACLMEACSKQHIKWNYPETVQSIAQNSELAGATIQALANYPVERETLYQLREVQKTFTKLNSLVASKGDLGFNELPDYVLEEALERELIAREK